MRTFEFTHPVPAAVFPRVSKELDFTRTEQITRFPFSLSRQTSAVFYGPIRYRIYIVLKLTTAIRAYEYCAPSTIAVLRRSPLEQYVIRTDSRVIVVFRFNPSSQKHGYQLPSNRKVELSRVTYSERPCIDNHALPSARLDDCSLGVQIEICGNHDVLAKTFEPAIIDIIFTEL